MGFKFWKKNKEQVKEQECAKSFGFGEKPCRIGNCFLCESDIEIKARVEYLNKERTSCKTVGTIWTTPGETMLCEKCRKAILKTIGRSRRRRHYGKS